MEIVITHLTRMRAPFIGVAGVDVATGCPVRPVPRRGRQLRSALLALNGGPFEMAARVDLGSARRVPHRPATEDHRFEVDAAASVGSAAPADFWRLLSGMARSSFKSIFGRDLKRRGARAATVELGRGEVSLGWRAPAAAPRLLVKSRAPRPSQVLIEVSDGTMQLELGVADIRLFAADHVTPDAAMLEQVAGRLAGGESVLLSVALSRASTPSTGAKPVHWVQVDNIHFESSPRWTLGSAVR